ncbi:MAG: SIMPL domain-containing protein [Crocinitomicaceae bacterium]
MKKLILSFLTISLITTIAHAQVSGNINYQNITRYAENNISVNYPNSNDLYITVKGMANVKADSYVAIFNLSQTGKTAKEVNELIDERVNKGLSVVKGLKSVEAYVDMISFVPVYEYAVERKIFSKKTYNEIPTGFEVKKNIHIKYTDPNLLNEIIASLANAEIYDLVRVDYFSNNIDAIKDSLLERAKQVLNEKMKRYESILTVNFDSYEKQLADKYKVVLPTEMYKSYQAYSSSSLKLKRNGNVRQAQKSNTLFYQPILDKEFDFVLNPTIIEPVIQVMYQIVVRVTKVKKEAPKPDKPNKEYMLVTPNGDIKPLTL